MAKILFDMFGAELRQFANDYWPTLAMAAATGTALPEEVRRPIDVRFAVQVRRHYAMSLQIAQRK